LRHVSFLAAIIVAALNIYSVSAQENGQAIPMPLQYTNSTGKDSQIVSGYRHLAKYYLNVNTDSSLYFANQIISFALLKNNWHYLENGLQVKQLAEEAKFNIYGSQNTFLLDELTDQKRRINLLIIISTTLFVCALIVFILYLRKGRDTKISEADNKEYKERMINIESALNDIQLKNSNLNTELKELQINYGNLQKRHDDLVKTNDIKDKLIPMIAHDIRSPLATLQNTLSLTRDNIISPEEFQKLSFALEADVFNLRGMLDNMLLWAREQMFEIKINKIKFDLSETFKEVILTYRNNLVTKNITLHNYMPEHLEVTSDKEIIAAVFRNLFSNAVKFTEPGKNIYISQIFFNGKAYISVKDEGKGIQQETLQKLNNKQHISTRGTANEKGTGLGLLFSKEMLIKLDEAFDITSYPNQGTSATFSVNMQ